MLYLELAISYWRFHKKRALSIIMAVLLGTAAIFCTLLLMRSLRVMELEEYLDAGGNYDLAFYVSSDKIAEEIKQDQEIEQFGVVYRLGMAQGENGKEFPVGCMEDQKTEKMWHQTPRKGRYPKQQGEITIDAQMMKSMGYRAETGQHISLTLQDIENKTVLSKTFTVVGIIEQEEIESSDMYSGGGGFPLRCYNPVSLTEDEVISAPYVYISSEDSRKFSDHSCQIILVNTVNNEQVNDYTVCEKYADNYLGEDGKWKSDDFRFEPAIRRRAITANAILSWREDEYVDENLNTNSTIEVEERIEEESGYPDYVTRILLPVITILIVFLTVISTYESVRAALLERTKVMGLLRCVGLTRKQSVVLLLAEVCSMGAIAILFGYLLGDILYEALRLVMKQGFGIILCSAFGIDKYFAPIIEGVTVSPFLFPGLIIGGSVLLTALLASISMGKLSPLQAYQPRQRAGKRRKKRMGGRYISPVRLLSSHIQGGRLRSKFLIGCNVFLIMASAVFGYVYFRTMADISNKELLSELENTNLADCDFFATKAMTSYEGNGMDDLFHNVGISQEQFINLQEAEGVERVTGTIVDRNTKLSVRDSEKNQELMDYLAEMNYCKNEAAAKLDPKSGDEESDRIQGLAKKEQKVMEVMGYADWEVVYNVPTIAVREEAMKDLESCVVAGELNWDKLNRGEETAVILTEDRQDLFSIGGKLALSQVIYPEELDSSDSYWGGIVPESIQKATKTYQVKYGAFSTEFQIYTTRKEINTRLGAVLVINPDEQEKLAKYYYCKEIMAGSCPVNFLTGVGAMEQWQVPDRNYTQVSVSLKEDVTDAGREQFEIKWDKELAGIKHMYAVSRAEKIKQIQDKYQMMMGIFVLLVITLAAIGLLGVANVFATQLQNMKGELSLTRLIGADRGLIRCVVLRRFLPIPIVCGFLSVLPVIITQQIYNYGMDQRAKRLKETADAVIYGSYDPNESLWYFRLPWGVNFYRYDLPLVVAVVTLIMISFFLFVLLPGIKKISRLNPMEEVKTEE